MHSSIIQIKYPSMKKRRFVFEKLLEEKHRFLLERRIEGTC